MASKNRILKKTTQIEWLKKIIMSYRVISYRWTGSVLSFIEYNINNWNWGRDFNDQIILYDLNIEKELMIKLSKAKFPTKRTAKNRLEKMKEKIKFNECTKKMFKELDIG